MGFLFDLPVTGPLKGFLWLAEKISEQADNELYSEEKIRGQLMELELRFDLDEISEEEYLLAEEELLDRLRIARERKANQAEK